VFFRYASFVYFPAKIFKCQFGQFVLAVKYLAGVVEELFDIVPKNTYITITSGHGELFGQVGHGPHPA
jgi:hypothetical protein